jgi:hypothetical protein
MSDVVPRFEFRAFAQTFGLAAEKVRRYAACRDIDESFERYLIVAGAENHNVKIRGGRLEIKRLIERRDSLERWEPVAETNAPVARGFLRETLFPALGVAAVDWSRAEYSIDDLLAEVVGPRREFWTATVFKRRFRFTVDDCPTEIDDLLINGAAIRSLAVEAEQPGRLLAVMGKLGLSEYENVNYPRAIRRVMGLEAWPSEAWYGEGNRTQVPG